MRKRVFSSSCKKMAVALSYAKGWVKEAAVELGIDPGRISKWGQQQDGSAEKPAGGLTEEQKEIRQLQKAFREAPLERDIDLMLTHVCGSKKAVSIFSRGDGRYSEHRNLFPAREDVPGAPREH